jgi:hypothetical protein
MTHNAGMRTSISTELREELADIVTCQDGDSEDENEEEEDGEKGKVDKYYLTAFVVYADGSTSHHAIWPGWATFRERLISR